MISFGMTEEQQMVRDTMREFADDVMRPLARECDESETIPDDYLQSVWDLGLTSTQLPEKYGGGGEARSPVTNAILLEELGYGDAALALAAVAPSQFANAILDHGSDEQKQQFLPLFCGDKPHAASLAIAEPDPVANPLAPRTLAEPKGEGFVLSGTKCFVVDGERASHFIVVARTDEGLEAFIVPRDAAGLTVSGPELNMGMRGLSTARLQLDSVEVGAEQRLGGPEGRRGDEIVRALVDNCRTALCAVMLGLSRAVLEYCVPYAKERVAFDEPISKKQSIAFRLAEMHIEIEAIRNLTWQAASRLEQGLDATRESRLANTYASEKCMWIADNGVQVLGGHGYIRENLVELWYRSARTLSVLEGAVAV